MLTIVIVGSRRRNTINDRIKTTAALNQLLKVKVIGVCRSYGTRHGNGPLNREHVIPKHHPSEHNNGGFAGTFRSGEFHLPAVISTIRHCGVTEVAVNHLDFASLYPFHREQIENVVPVTIEGYGPTAEDKKKVGEVC